MSELPLVSPTIFFSTQAKAQGNIISTYRELEKTASHCLALYSTANTQRVSKKRKHADLLKYLLPQHNPAQHCLKEEREENYGWTERKENGMMRGKEMRIVTAAFAEH